MNNGSLGIIWLILSCLGFFVMVFGIRYLKGKENMAMIEKGMDPKLNVRRPAPFITLKWGLLMVGAGIGLMAAFILGEYVLNQQDKYGNRLDEGRIVFLYFALIAIGGGLGLISSYKIEKKELLDKQNNQ
jgi:hypothetical protein